MGDGPGLRYADDVSRVTARPRTQNVMFGLSAIIISVIFGSIALYSSTASAQEDDLINHFVRVQEGRFVVGPECKPFYISGWNGWEINEMAAGALHIYGSSIPSNMTGPQLIRTLLEKARTYGFNSVRAWAHPVSLDYSLMNGPGQYNEAIFRGLDYFIDECRKYKIRPILAFVDNWQPAGGIPQWNSFVGEESHDVFFSSDQIKQLYKDHISVVLNRVNSINGRVYKDDPTILSWELLNEPRCSTNCGDNLQNWISEMAAHVKSIDRNHLLTVGEEGFYRQNSPEAEANPGLWAGKEGQHFPQDHADPNIDYTSIHLWAQNWDDSNPDFLVTWIRQHIQDAKKLQKPLLMGEFGAWGVGKYKKERFNWYNMIYGLLMEDIQAWGPVQGALFWTWFEQGQRAPEEESKRNPGGLFGVYDTEPTFDLVRKFTRNMNEINTYSFTGVCKAEEETIAIPVDGCTTTWVNNLPGTGFEGPMCDIDINECARGTHNCDEHGGCVNTVGGFACTCFHGYSGDGRNCTLNDPVMNTMMSSFFTNGFGQRACWEGEDVPFPPATPGFAYDLTDPESLTKAQIGSRRQVSQTNCMMACMSTPDCNSFAYNDYQKSCFLKKTNSTDTCQHPPTFCVSTRGDIFQCGSWETYFNSDRMRFNVHSASTFEWQDTMQGQQRVTHAPPSILEAYYAAKSKLSDDGTRE